MKKEEEITAHFILTLLCTAEIKRRGWKVKGKGNGIYYDVDNWRLEVKLTALSLNHTVKLKGHTLVRTPQNTREHPSELTA